MPLERKQFALEPEFWKIVEEVRDREKCSSEAHALRVCLLKVKEIIEGKPIPEAPKTIPVFEIPSEILEKAKEVNTCKNYEAYPQDPKNFVKCHIFEKPRIRSIKECETCNQKRTLYDEASKDLNLIAQKKKELEAELQAKETSLRTVASEYQRIKKELEILQQQRAKFGEAQPVSPDPILIQKIKELEAQIEELKKAPEPASEVKVPSPQFVFLTESLLSENGDLPLECMARCANWNPDMSTCPYPPYEPPEKCHFFKPLPTPRFEIQKEADF